MVSHCYYLQVDLQRKVRARGPEGKQMSFQGSNRRRDWGPSLGIPPGSGATVESEKLEEDGRCAAMETGGGGRSQREGVMDNVKCHIRAVGGGEGKRVMRVSQSPQVQSPTCPAVKPQL